MFSYIEMSLAKIEIKIKVYKINEIDHKAYKMLFYTNHAYVFLVNIDN